MTGSWLNKPQVSFLLFLLLDFLLQICTLLLECCDSFCEFCLALLPLLLSRLEVLLALIDICDPIIALAQLFFISFFLGCKLLLLFVQQFDLFLKLLVILLRCFCSLFEFLVLRFIFFENFDHFLFFILLDYDLFLISFYLLSQFSSLSIYLFVEWALNFSLLWSLVLKLLWHYLNLFRSLLLQFLILFSELLCIFSKLFILFLRFLHVNLHWLLDSFYMLIKVFLYVLPFLRLSLTDFLVLFLELFVLPIVFSSDIFELSFDDICLHRPILVLEGLTVEKLSIGGRIHGSLIYISDKWNNVFQKQLIHSISPLLICQICHTGSFACLKCSNLIH